MARFDSNPLIQQLEAIQPHEAAGWYFNAAVEIAINRFGVESEENLAEYVKHIAVEDAWDVAISYPHNLNELKIKLGKL